MLTVLIPIIAIALVAFVAVPFMRGRDAVDLSPQSVFRAYLYVASFAGVAVAAFGIAALLQAAIALFAGNEFVYGAFSSDTRLTQAQQFDARRAEDAVRGVTFAAFGLAFWLVHWLARNRFAQGDQGALARGYFLIGTAVFGVATVILFPMGLYQGLTYWLVPRAPGAFRSGVQDTLAGGIVVLAIWLLYLRIVLSHLPPRTSSRTAGAEAAIPTREDR